MPPKKPVAPPRLAPVRLPGLEKGTGDDAAAHTRVELLTFEDVDLSGRDLSGLEALETRFVNVTMNQTKLRNASFVDTVVERLDAPVLTAPGWSLRDVEVTASRIASADLYDSTWQSVHFSGCKLGYLNLRNAVIRDVKFTGCTIDELDLGGAKLSRVAFEDTRLDTLDVQDATLDNFDLRGAILARVNGVDGLRGAVLTPTQVEAMAQAFAERIGIRIVS